MVYNPKLSYDPYEIALKIENQRLTEENFRLNEELQYYKTGSNLKANMLSINDPITEQMVSNDIVLHRVAVANASFKADKFSYHLIGRWEGGKGTDDPFSYSYYVSKEMVYQSIDKARLVQMLMEKTAHALARRILGEK